MKWLVAVVGWLPVVLWLSGPATARSGADMVRDGRQAYVAGDFAAASRDFQDAFAREPDLATPAFCLDASLAARLAGESGLAALWLYRAVLTDPHDGETAKALAAAGLDAGKLFAGPWFLGAWLPLRRWWLLALWANACFWLGLTGVRLVGRSVPRSLWLAGGLALGLCWLAVGWGALAGRCWPRGVVVQPQAVQSAPEAGAEALFDLSPGACVTVGRKTAGWALVRTADGRAGWAPRDAIAALHP